MKSDRGHSSAKEQVPSVHVTIVTDSPTGASGFFACLASHRTPQFIVQTTPSARVQTALRHDTADVCIVDLAHDAPTDVPLAKVIHDAHPELPLVIVSDRPDPLVASRALRAGALGYVSHADPPTHLINAVIQAKQHKRFVSEAIMQGILLSMNDQPASEPGDASDKGK